MSQTVEKQKQLLCRFRPSPRIDLVSIHEGRTLVSEKYSLANWEIAIIKEVIETLLFIGVNKFCYSNLHPRNIILKEKGGVVFKNFGYSEEFE